MSSIESLKETARRHEQKEQWRQALDQYSQAIKKLEKEEQPDIGLYNRVGDLQIRIGDFDASAEAYEQAVDLYVESGLPNNAIAVCKKIIRNMPQRNKVYLRMGQIRAEQGFLVDARANFLTYAERMQAAGEMDEAFRALVEFADLAPEDVEIRMAVATQLEQSEREEEAVEQLSLGYRQARVSGNDEMAGAFEAKLKEIDPSIDLESVANAGSPMGFETSAIGGGDELGGDFEDMTIGHPAEQELDDDFAFDIRDDEEAEALPTFDTEEKDAEESEPLKGTSTAGDDEEVAEPVPTFEDETEPSPTFDLEDEDEAEPLPTFDMEDEDEAEPLPTFDTEDEDEAEPLPTFDVEDDEESEPLPTFDMEDDEDSEPLQTFEMGGDDELDAPPVFGAEREDASEGAVPMQEAMEEAAFEEAAAAPEAPESETDRLAASRDSLAETGDIDGALAASGELLELEPDDVGHRQRQVELAFQKNDDTVLAAAYLELAKAMERDGQDARAQAVYQQVLTVDPGNEEARAALGEAGETSAPVQEVASSESYVDLGGLIFDEEEKEKTTRFQVAYEEPSGDEQADFAKMLSQFKSKVSENLGTDDVRAHHDLGTAYKEMGLLDEAIEEFQAALRASAHHLPTYELLGQTFMEKGQDDAAVRSLTRALDAPYEVEDELVGIYYYLGRAHEKLGNTESAKEFYDRVFSLDINFADVTERLRNLR